jgi:hypothetical protein
MRTTTRRATTFLLGLLGLSCAGLLLGCDAGAEPLAGAADAEAAGDFTGAAVLYRKVCEKGSSLCPIATLHSERLRLKEARRALEEGHYGKAKEALDAAAVSSDAGVKRAAETMSKLADLQSGVAWEEASSAPDQDEALPKIEALAEAGAAVSAKAREWIAKNRPGLLLARVEAACQSGGAAGAAGSCTETARELQRLHEGSPEAAEAQRLAGAEYARIFPLLGEAEQTLQTRFAVYEIELRIGWCTQERAVGSWGSNREEFRPACQAEVSPEPMPTVESLTETWEKHLAQIHDPHFVKGLEQRWKAAGESGYVPQTWPKPGAKKK